MENKLYYIIGIAVVLVGGVIIYAINMPTKPAENVAVTDQMSQDNLNNLQNTSQNDIVASGTIATTTTITKPTTNTKMKSMYTVKMETNKGNITLQLDTNIAPKTVANFVKLAGSGFYDGVKFHRVIKDFMIQTGDPQSKDDSLVSAWGTGGPGYKFEDELTETAKLGYKRGTLAMANSGPNTNGSQFFIVHKDYGLPPLYTIFGHVTSGLDVVDAIANTATGPNDRPVSAVIITKVTVE